MSCGWGHGDNGDDTGDGAMELDVIMIVMMMVVESEVMVRYGSGGGGDRGNDDGDEEGGGMVKLVKVEMVVAQWW